MVKYCPQASVWGLEFFFDPVTGRWRLHMSIFFAGVMTFVVLSPLACQLADWASSSLIRELE